MTQHDTDIEIAIGQIRAYLAMRPHGADTPEGVAQWWLDGIFPPEVVEAALERLLASGEMDRVNMGQRQLWQRARAV